MQAFINAQNDGDVDAALALLADDAVIQLIPPPAEGDDGIFSGKEEVRTWYENLASLHGRGEISNVQVDGNQVTALLSYTDDSLKAIGVEAIDNDWVVVMKDDKIQSYTATITDGSLAELMAAMEAMLAETKTDAAVQPQDVVLIVTFDGSECAYEASGPVTPGHRFTVVLDLADQDDFEAYGLAAVLLDEGKTFEDLDAWASTNAPVWAHVIGLRDEVPAGSRAETTITTFEGPLYFVCFTAYPVTKSDVLGPIPVGEAE